MTTISVAMITCEGAAYVAEQLDSILAQTRLPDEIVVVDDRSEDATVRIIERALAPFAGTVSVTVNPHRLGVVGNLARALARCTGDIVVLADQDDVWEPRKLDVLARRLEEHPGIDGVFTDATLIAVDGLATGPRLWQSVGFGEREQARWRTDPLEILLRREVVTGATLAVRRGVMAEVAPIPDLPGGLHDSWIALLLAADGRLYAEPQPLIRYRQHAANVAGLHAGGWRDHLRRGRQALDDAPARAAFLQAAAQRIDDPVASRRIIDAAGHLETRGALPRNLLKRPRVVAGELRRYRRYSGGWRTAVWDLGVPRGRA